MRCRRTSAGSLDYIKTSVFWASSNETLFVHIMVHQDHHPAGFETPTTVCGSGKSGTLHRTSSCLPSQSASDAGLHFLQIDMSCQRVASEHPVLGSFGPLPIVRALVSTMKVVRGNLELVDRPVHPPIAEGRVAALFRCTLNPVVLHSRNLETSIPRQRQLPSKRHLAHTATRLTDDAARFAVLATASC